MDKQDSALKARLKELATQKPAYSYLLLHALLKAEGLVINRKRSYRIYTEEGLQVRTKRRKKLHRPRQLLNVPTGVNERWSMDFVSDQLTNVRRFCVLNVVDDFSRDMVDQLVANRLTDVRWPEFWSNFAKQEVNLTGLFAVMIQSLRAKRCSSGVKKRR